MLVANTKGRMSTLAVDDDLDMNGRNVTNADVVSVNEHVTLVGARLPGKGFRHVERDGWTVSKDNNDIERKFWKPDLHVTGEYLTPTSSGVVLNTTEGRYEFEGGKGARVTDFAQVSSRKGKISCVVQHSAYTSTASRHLFVVEINQDSANNIQLSLYEGDPGNICALFTKRVNNVYSIVTIPTIAGYNPLAANRFEASWDLDTGAVTIDINGYRWVNWDSTTLFDTCNSITISSGSVVFPFYLSDLSIAPDESYADNFATDTVSGANGRYQAVTGTVAYDGVNKRMNITTATGANGKASGRLKSYKFTEGSQIFDVTLPTGADGDFITLVTHSANGLMTDGIGVGLQSDGAGNWNLATLSGTTVTEGADSGLDDDDVARIEIEKDVTGAYWYYIYDAAGAKPTTATGKLFTTLTEGYTGWYANGAGATTQTYAIDNISIRAESIVGRTNVPVEEPFWFRDEFSENSLGRYKGQSSAFKIENGHLTAKNGYSQISLPGFVVKPTIVCRFSVMNNGEDEARFAISYGLPDDTYTGGILDAVPPPEAVGTRYFIYIRNATTTDYTFKKFVNGTNYSSDLSVTSSSHTHLTPGVEYQITVSWVNTNTVSCIVIDPSTGTQYGNITIVDLNTSGTGILDRGYVNITDSSKPDWRIHSIDVTGTRVYNKPIHRGAMLESYWDGSEEVVATTFVDDCQWVRSAEYTSLRGRWTRDTINGYIQVANTSSYGNGYLLNSLQFDEGVIEFDVCRNSVAGSDDGAYGVVLLSDGTLNPSYYHHPTNGILIVTSGNGGEYVNGARVGSAYTLVTLASNLVWQNWRIELKKSQGQILLYLDGVLANTYTIAQNHANRGIVFFAYNIEPASNVRFKNIQIIAAESSSTNGIAACIPPVGGGARYGVEEEVYFDIDNEVRYNESVVMATVKTLDPANEGVEMFFGNTTDSSKITADDTDVEVISLEDASYKDVVKDIVLNYDDRGDEIKVGVRKTGDNVATVYVETLAVVPKVEVV